METLTRKFQPCARGDHDYCLGAYYDNDGTRHVCACAHHRQGVLLAELKVESKQRELF